MKKILISALSLSILLAGCGQDKQENKGVTKIEKSEETVKYISDEKLKKDVQKFIDEFTSNSKTFLDSTQSDGMSDDPLDNIKETSKLFENLNSEINKYVNENNLNKKDEKNIKYIAVASSQFGSFINNMVNEAKKLESGDITEEQYDKSINEFVSTKEAVESDKNLSSAIKYFERKGVNVSEYLKLNSDSNKAVNSTVTSDPLEFINKDQLIFENGETGDSLKILKIFKNENTDENGFNEIDNNGFISNLAFVLVEDTNTGEKSLGYFGENINKTDKHIHFLGSVEFTTDTGEQIQPDGGVFETNNKLIKEYNPNVKSKGYGIVKLDYQKEIPKSIEVKISQPQNNDDTNYWGQDITLNLK